MFTGLEQDSCNGYIIVDLKVESLRKVSRQQFFLVVFSFVAAWGKLLCVDALGVTVNLNFLPVILFNCSKNILSSISEPTTSLTSEKKTSIHLFFIPNCPALRVAG